MKKIILFLAISFSGLLFSQKTREITVGQPFKFSYPENYLKTYELNDVAVLQIMNAAQEKYTIIIQEDKESLDAAKVVFSSAEEGLMFYSKNIINGLLDNDLKKVSKPKNYTLNGYDFSEITIEGENLDEETKEKIKFFYLYTVIKTNTNFYQILSWSALENKKAYLEEFRNMAKTLKEIPVN